MAVIAFIGLGNMGSGMAVNLVKAGHEVRGFDLNQDAVAALSAKGGKAAASVLDAVRGADAVVTMLPAGKHVRGIYEGEEGIIAHAGADTVLMDCSTIDVDSARAVGEAAAKAGIKFVDAPVSGGVAAAEGGTLTFMVGGPEDAFEAAKPYLENMGKAVIRAGDAGAGQAAKICNNMLLGIHMIGTCEAFVLAQKLGLDPQRFFDISSKASGQSWSMTSYCPVPGPVPAAPSNRGYKPGFAAPMMLKDLRLALETARSAGAAIPLGAHAEKLYTLFTESGGSEKDFSGIIEMIAANKTE
ncbi:3-hydroxyisobutyrate dehydrogenase [Glycocaulis albus]|jgi:3-hydroxyisobutyrate dehydrogenase|uniref:3-hydroxyisobutyrate dehydrogenase n=1 Tax=Glycocaulis albus TaxID=1382801 RepID=A0ABQ1XG96_9PROT|nr:3-hydroxyisobutyrate dehydrogenase [Glycocaulis albus]MBV5258463.1 3-hydroxyisobutyrate dehydrogenase [Synechococcus moorigangaii CMS01]GGG92863.1 3-hydroxyisobutyrate dehydrogenase [Glycocaulis albus]